MSRRPPRRTSARQGGAALLTAMIIVTLVATLASAMVWQQWRAVQVESAERARAQSVWILAGALDFALLILREDQKTSGTGKPTRLTEPWATPLAESRLSTFLSADNAADSGDDGPEAFLSGTILDAEAKFNINNLVLTADEKQKTIELQTLSRLCDLVGIDASVATQLATQLTFAYANAGEKGSEAAPLRPLSVDQLSWLGIGAASIRALEPFVILLPEATLVNVNTASREVLAAALGTDLGSADRLVQIRQRTAFTSREDVLNRLALKSDSPTGGIQASISRYFEIEGRLRLADRVVTQRTLVNRPNAPNRAVVVRREIVSKIEETSR